MFIRKLEKGECWEHQGRWKCRSSALFECDHCHLEFIVHGLLQRVRRSYCSVDCTTEGNKATTARAIENRQRFLRTKYGISPAKLVELKAKK
jgi:hypothetical protein